MYSLHTTLIETFHTRRSDFCFILGVISLLGLVDRASFLQGKYNTSIIFTVIVVSGMTTQYSSFFSEDEKKVDQEFIQTPTSVTPTAESERDLLLRNHTPVCVCPQSCTCSQCIHCANSSSIMIRPPSATLSTPLLMGSENRDPHRYGSITHSPKESVSDKTEPLIRSSDIRIVNSDLPPDGSIRCGCHVKQEDPTSRKARIKLIIACVIALLFMIGEVVGKYESGYSNYCSLEI